MTQVKSLRSSEKFKVIGPGKVLPYLRGDLQKAHESLFVIGPWIDGYFIKEVNGAIKEDIVVRFLVRLANSESRLTNLNDLEYLSNQMMNFEARSLQTLHAKVIIIDDNVVYVGSTNWYKYSLEHTPEVTLRGHVSDISNFQRIIEGYWNKAEPVNLEQVKDGTNNNLSEIDYEILDPLARKALEANPKAFIKTIQNK